MVGQVHLYALSDPRETHEVRRSYSDASPIQNGSAVFARIEMFLYSLAERGLYGLIDVVRQFPPNLNAADVYGGLVTRV
jgi:hypothetical protein